MSGFLFSNKKKYNPTRRPKEFHQSRLIFINRKIKLLNVSEFPFSLGKYQIRMCPNFHLAKENFKSGHVQISIFQIVKFQILTNSDFKSGLQILTCHIVFLFSCLSLTLCFFDPFISPQVSHKEQKDNQICSLNTNGLY